MPLIISIEAIPDNGGGLRVVTTAFGTVVLTKQDLPGNIRTGTAQEIEDYINGRMDAFLPKVDCSYIVRVHVLTTTPLVMQIIAINEGETLPPNWWIVMAPR